MLKVWFRVSNEYRYLIIPDINAVCTIAVEWYVILCVVNIIN
jgi:hypothetical protein